MTVKTRIPLAKARALAAQLVLDLGPYTERIMVAGSIRREKPDIGDVELLYVPRYEQAGQVSLFDGLQQQDMMDVHLRESIRVGVFAKRLNAKNTPIGYGELNKYLVHRQTGIAVDIFATEARNWGMALIVRTGPAEFNVNLMARLKQTGYQGHAYGGATDGNNEEIELPDEHAVFQLAGWDYIQPERRG